MAPLAVFTLMALCGCSSGHDAETRFGAVVQREAGALLLVAAKEPQAGGAALVGGTLMRTDRGCISLDVAGVVTAVLFPFGSELAPDGESVQVPGSGVMRVGDKVERGGGVGYLKSLSGVPDECRTGESLVVWD